jgi:hypothetical protein
MSDDRPVYDLLPAIHRLRDAERDGPLSALLAVVEQELAGLTEDVDGLYDDWFVETCADWVVPYLGDLLGVHGLRGSGLRALVANTIRYRRRKGTPGVIEQVARDATGWPARVVENYRLLSAFQHLDHVRPDAARTASLRDAVAPAPFDATAHTVDVRGRYNIPDVSVFLWRLAAYPVQGVRPRKVAGGWTFDPAGRDLRLFHRGRTETGAVDHLAEEADVPAPLRRRALLGELSTGMLVQLAEPQPALLIRFGDEVQPPARLVIRDLTGWAAPENGPDGQRRIAVDPVLGRIALSPGSPAAPDIWVDYAYGFPGDIGAGPHDRQATLTAALEVDASPPEVGWSVRVAATGTADPGRTVRTLGDALRLWDSHPELSPGQVGVIAVTDSATYTEDLDIRLRTGERLIVAAAAWPEPAGRPGVDVLAATARGLRPHLTGSVRVVGDVDGELVVDGLSIEGGVHVADGGLARLTLSDCTMIGAGRLTVDGNRQLTVRLLRDVLAGADLGDATAARLTDTVIYGPAFAAAEARTGIDGCTILGAVTTRILTAGNSILLGPVCVRQVQQGCVRFSYLPADSRSPRRYHCCSAAAPVFTSTDPADPGFGQLAAGCPVPISTGADDDGEMGAYHFLGQPVRMSNLAAQLEVYLRFGLTAGVFLVT